MKKRFALTFALLSLLSFGCFGPKSADSTADSQAPAAADESAKAADANVPSEYVDIAEWCRPGMAEPVDAKAWAKANNAFGFKLLKEMKGNAVFSPYSIERALGMALEGACGTTATEMLTALDMPNAKRLSMTGHDVDGAMSAVNKDTQLEIENNLWPDTSLKLPNDYIARVQAGYDNKLTVLDYKADPEKARTTINDHIAKATHDRIKDLLIPGSINDLTKLVLTNSVYFKASWVKLFEESHTANGVFFASEKQIETPMMSRTDEDAVVCISKDYAYYDLKFKTSDKEKGSYIMRIILPTIDENTKPMSDRMKLLETVENQLSNGFDVKCETHKVFVSLPKFKLAPDSISLKDMLSKFGMTKAFDKDSAEFFAMPNTAQEPADKSSYLHISNILHKAYIEIDEKGGKAAAATAVDMAANSMEMPVSYEFKADHPFVYMIIEESTGAALFMGRVTDPQ